MLRCLATGIAGRAFLLAQFVGFSLLRYELLAHQLCELRINTNIFKLPQRF